LLEEEFVLPEVVAMHCTWLVRHKVSEEEWKCRATMAAFEVAGMRRESREWSLVMPVEANDSNRAEQTESQWSTNEVKL
jgi:hypothetical protein